MLITTPEDNHLLALMDEYAQAIEHQLSLKKRIDTILKEREDQITFERETTMGRVEEKLRKIRNINNFMRGKLNEIDTMKIKGEESTFPEREKEVRYDFFPSLSLCVSKLIAEKDRGK